MSNLDAIRALQARQAEAAARKYEPLDWDVEVGPEDDSKRKRARGRGADGDAKIKSMLEEVDLLALIQSDTGEDGRKSGERVDFHSCPICGHRDCFSFYPKTNSWTCFGASNTSGYEGGTALEYYKATRGVDDRKAVKWLREQTGHLSAGEEKGEDDNDVEAVKDDGFPPITPSEATNPPRRAPVLIEGVLRKGHILLVTARETTGEKKEPKHKPYTK